MLAGLEVTSMGMPLTLLSLGLVAFEMAGVVMLVSRLPSVVFFWYLSLDSPVIRLCFSSPVDSRLSVGLATFEMTGIALCFRVS